MNIALTNRRYLAIAVAGLLSGALTALLLA